MAILVLIKFFYPERWKLVNRIEALPSVWLLSEKALWLPGISTIVIADVHLGYESGLFDEPFYPRIQFRDVAERMEALMKRYSPERVIIDGDLKHEFSSMPYSEFSEVREFLDIMEGTEITLVRGNHDNFIVGYLKKRGVEVVERLSTERFFFIHGHEYADIPEGKMTVIGHEHPIVRIRDSVGGSAVFPCFIVSDDLIVVPAFSEISGGSDAVKGGMFLSPILKNKPQFVKRRNLYAVSEGQIIYLGEEDANL